MTKQANDEYQRLKSCPFRLEIRKGGRVGIKQESSSWREISNTKVVSKRNVQRKDGNVLSDLTSNLPGLTTEYLTVYAETLSGLLDARHT